MATRDEQFETIRERADGMVNDDQVRVALYVALREMFRMEWDGKPRADWIRQVVSPDAYNAVVGILRLMMAAEPQIRVPSGESTIENVVRDDRTERALRALLHRADEARDVAALYDAVISATLFGEVVLRVGCSADVVDLVKGTNKALAAMAARVPFTIDALNPATVFVDSDVLGLRRVVIVEETSAGHVKEFWGTLAEGLGDDDAEVELYDYWDRTWRAVWVKNAAGFVLCEEHGLPFIPIVRRVVQGTKLWTTDDGETVWPLLYPMYKSGLWDAQNIALTMIYSLAYAMGSVPFLALEKESPSQPDPEIDWSQPGINVRLLRGQRIVRVAQDAIPQEMMTLLNLVESKTPESLMPKVVFGQSPGGSTSFSALNLLSQGGRLPLVPIQERVGDAMGSALEIVLRWIAEEGKALELYDAGVMYAIDPQQIDKDRVWVDVRLDPAMPQDRMSTAAVVTQLIDRQVISRKTGREWMHVDDDTGETEQILLEKFVTDMAEAWSKQAGQVADVGEMLGGDWAEPEVVDQMGEGQLFNTGQGGIPSVQAGMMPQVEPLMPGGGALPPGLQGTVMP